MSGQLLLVNPRKRKAKKSRRRARRSARRSNPVHAVKRYRARRGVRKSYSRRRRNPALSLGGFRASGLTGKAMGAIWGAGGALLNDVLLTYVPLPGMLKSGPLAILSKAAGAFGVGYLASFALGKARGAQLTEGALTVLAYQVAKPMVSTMLPLAGDDIEGLGYYSPGAILQDSLSPLTDLNAGTPLAAYISGLGGADYVAGGGMSNERNQYDSTIDSYIE